MAQVQSPAARRLLALGNGGHIRGPGTGTSDSIDIKASDGEFILPADTVKKVGVKSLRDLVALTHTPTEKSKADHYANGGLVDDPGAVTREGNSYSGGDVRGNITVNGQAPGGTYSEAPGMAAAPSPAAAPSATAASSAPAAATAPGATPTAASPAAAPATPTAGPAAPMDWAARTAQRNLEVTASSIMPSRDRDAAKAALRAADGSPQPAVGTPAISRPAAAPEQPPPPPAATPQITAPPSTFRPQPLTPASDLRDRQATTIPRFADGGLVTAEEQREGLRGLAERLAQIPTDGYPKAPVADGSQDSWANTEVGRNAMNLANAVPGATGNLTSTIAKTGGAVSRLLDAGLQAVRTTGAGGTLAPTGATPPAAVASPAAANRGSSLAHYNEGELMGPPSEAMPSRATAAGPAPAPAQPAGNGAGNEAYGRLLAIANGTAPSVPAMPVPEIRHSGNDWQARNDLRNAAVAASSIKNTQQWGGRGAENNPAMQEYRAMLATDQALKQAQPGVEMAGMRERGSLQRERMEQQGSQQRAALGALGAMEGNQIARGRLTLDQIAAGYQTRSAARLEAAQQAVENAQTPAEQRNARQRLLTLLGKDGEDRWKSVALQGGTDAQGNKTESILGAVNERTGEMRRMPTQAQPTAAPPDGSMVRGKDGRLYEVKNGQPVLVGG
ncbi:hypothetical protein [Delftia lacustris]|uniref:hypothetical protein n=1 Tax=Delftia lacustris TaxID=558537 RepID=UPI001FCC023D|nr:hypothetical protein [Delftia lacustris]BDE74072.1 hypothetical protein HQS1_51960 [Delftia lacustris]